MSATPASTSASTSTVDRPIGYVASDLGGRSPAEIVELLTRTGYGAVDWTMEQYDPLVEPAARLREMTELARGEGLAVAQLMVHQDHVALEEELWEQRVRRAECAVLACAHADIESIGVLTGPNAWEPGAALIGADLSEAHAWELALRALERVLTVAERECVRVALEPCWGTLAHGRYRAEHALAALDCAALAVNFDPSHHALCGDDIAGAVRAWGGRIAHVHLKDVFGFFGPAARAGGSICAPRAHARGGLENETPDTDFLFLLPGEGAVPWNELFDALDAIGYTGAMSVENEAHRLLRGPLRGDVERAAQLARELVAGLLDEHATTWAGAAV
jgi:sugar phosphate isomerase/epimerase